MRSFRIRYRTNAQDFLRKCAYLPTANLSIPLPRIDYSKKAEEWMKPLVKGQPTGMVEIPGSWYIDDLPPMMFMKNSANSHGWVNPRLVRCATLIPKADSQACLPTCGRWVIKKRRKTANQWECICLGMWRISGVITSTTSTASTTSSSSR